MVTTFRSLPIKNNAMDLAVQRDLCYAALIYFAHGDSSEIARSNCHSAFYICIETHTVFQFKICSAKSTQISPFSPHPHQHLIMTFYINQEGHISFGSQFLLK